MRSRFVCVFVVLSLLWGPPGIGAMPARATAQDDEPKHLESDLFGLTISWEGDWQTVEIKEGDGIVWIFVLQDQGATELMFWAMPAFGGNEDVCIADSERRLLADPRNSDVEQGDRPNEQPVSGGESALFEFDFEPEGGRPTGWTLAAWCLELQDGYSVLQIELSAPTEYFNSALDALDDIDVTTTPDLPAPEFALDAERDDLTAFWSQQFSAWERDTYVAPSHVSFSSRQLTACGPVNPLDAGWFYCSNDNGLFMDIAAAEDLEARYGRSINVFLLAHETGHHVEMLLGYVPCSLSECLSETGDMQFELMADCFAGAWMANSADRGVLSERDIEDVLVAVADSFSDPLHGTSALRLWWLLQGFHIGPDVCFQPVTQQ